MGCSPKSQPTSAGSCIDKEGFTRYLEERIKDQRVIPITKEIGLFTAVRS